MKTLKSIWNLWIRCISSCESTQVLAKLFRASRPAGETTAISTTGTLRLCEAVLRSCCDPCLFSVSLYLLWREVAFKKYTKTFWRQQNTKSSYVTDSGRNSKTISSGRNKSTYTSSELWSETILLRPSATNRWIFFLLKWNLSLTWCCKTNGKSGIGIKGLVILRRGEYIHVIFLTKLCLLSCKNLLFCSVDTPFTAKYCLLHRILLSSLFSVHVHYFPWSFIF